MTRRTTGEGPGFTLRARNGSGAVSVRLDLRLASGELEILDLERGGIFGVGLSPDEMRALAKALLKMSAAALAFDEDATERWSPH